MVISHCDVNGLMNTREKSSENGAPSVTRATRSGRVSKPRDVYMFTHPERKRDTPVRKSNRIQKVEVAYTPPLTPADRKRNQRCLQGNNKRELDKSQTQVRVQKHRMAQPETVHEAEKTQTLVRVQKLCESQTEAVRKTERIEGSDRSAP